MKEKIRIAIYSRKSKYSDKGDSVGNQVEMALKYVEQYYPSDKYDVKTVIYEDDGFSGGNTNRPQFKEFLNEEKRMPFNLLICYRLDRISRNIADFSTLMSYITELGTSFVSIKEQFDTKTPMGRAMMYIASVFSQLEREVIAERIRDNMIELAKTGRWLGGSTPTGYNSKRIEIIDVYEDVGNNIIEKKKKTASKLVPIDEEIKLIEEIGYKFLELKSLNKLENYFLEKNISSRKNMNYSVSTLRKILVNPVYAPNDLDVLEYFKSKGITIYADEDRAKFDGKYGLLGYGKKEAKKDNDMKDWIISVGRHPPAFKQGIIWVRIQNLLEKNKEKRYRADCKHDFLLSGILRCSECGSYMRPKVAKGERFYYVCELKEKSKRSRCNSKNITGLMLDKLILQKLSEILVPASEIYKELSKMAINKDQTASSKKEEELKRKLNLNMDSICNLINKLKYMDTEVVDLINEELKKLRLENKLIREELLEIEFDRKNEIKFQSKCDFWNLDNIMDNCLKNFKYLDIKAKKDIVKLLIEDMRGSGDKVDVKLKNTNINQIDKKLFSDTLEKTSDKKE